MEFIGTEVGIKIRSAIKAKLTEIGKTVDDELIDYIMVMVANKKEETQMARDLQPFLESDTVKFTSWLHKVLQKLEQVTVIVTDDEYKIATSAFSKVGKKRKNTESASNKKKLSTKDEPKEKKKKVKHEHGKHAKNSVTGVSKPSVTSKIQTPIVNKHPKIKNVTVAPQQNKTEIKAVKTKKTKTEIDVCTEPTTSLELKKQVVTETPVIVQPKAAEPIAMKSPSTPRVAVPVQRPVMMVSDDDDDDDDFINIKTDVAEEELLLEEDRVQGTAQLTPVEQPEKEENVAPKSRTMVCETPQIEETSSTQMISSKKPTTLQPVVNETTVRQALVTPNSDAVSKTSEQSSTRRLLIRTTQNPVPRKTSPVSTVRPVSTLRSTAVSSTKNRPPILSRIGAVLKRKAQYESDEEEDVARNGSVASVVKVKPRPKVPAAAQAPKNLLLRAMADAQRSVATAPTPRVLPDAPSKRSPLFTKRFRDRQQESEMMERFAVTLPNVPDSNEEDEEEHMEQNDTQLLDETHEAYVPELVKTPSTLPVDVIYSPSPIVKSSVAKEETEAPRSSTPEFLVTLDGYKGYDYAMNYIDADTGDLEEYIPQAADDEPSTLDESKTEETDEKEFEVIEKPRRQKIVFNTERVSEDTESATSKKILLKSLDRCRFWPACRLGDTCTYHHPTQPCKSFPNCTFGDRCLYIHPNCKFDAVCTRKDCPFTHASPRSLTTVPVVPIVPISRPVPQRHGGLTCRFYPNCSNTNCRFYHPKSIGIPCRYGRLCSKPECSFIHSDIPPKEKMKWVSTVR